MAKIKPRQPKKRITRLGTLASLCLAVLVVPLIVVAQGYVEPVGPPPDSAPTGRPAIEFLNASNIVQRKVGSLRIGESFAPGTPNPRTPNCSYDTTTDTWTATSGCSKLCLNADPSFWTQSPITECIRNWQDLRALTGGPFLRLLPTATAGNIDGTDGACGGALPDPDCGVISLESDTTKNQLISFMAEAFPTGTGAVGFQAKSSSTSHYAAYLDGDVKIVSPTGNVELCLNGDCITSWAAVAPGMPADAALLQTTTFLETQNGAGGVPGTVGLNGPLFVNSLVLGTPNAQMVGQTCGDGICSTENSESNASCSMDCPL